MNSLYRSNGQYSRDIIFIDLVKFYGNIELTEVSNGKGLSKLDRLCKRAMSKIEVPEDVTIEGDGGYLEDDIMTTFIDRIMYYINSIDLERPVAQLQSLEEGWLLSSRLRRAIHTEVNYVISISDDLTTPFLALQSLFDYYIHYAVIQSLYESVNINRYLYDATLRFLFDLGHTYQREVRLSLVGTSTRYPQFGGEES